MEEWAMCNKCYRRLKNSRKVFSVTQCQHIFCSLCVPTDKNHCPECEKPNVRTMALHKPLQQPVVDFFGSLPALMEKSLQVAQFQRTQALIVVGRYRDMVQKYAILKKSFFQASNYMKLLTEAHKNLEQDMKKRSQDYEIERSFRMAKISQLAGHDDDDDDSNSRPQVPALSRRSPRLSITVAATTINADTHQQQQHHHHHHHHHQSRLRSNELRQQDNAASLSASLQSNPNWDLSRSRLIPPHVDGEQRTYNGCTREAPSPSASIHQYSTYQQQQAQHNSMTEYPRGINHQLAPHVHQDY